MQTILYIFYIHIYHYWWIKILIKLLLVYAVIILCKLYEWTRCLTWCVVTVSNFSVNRNHERQDKHRPALCVQNWYQISVRPGVEGLQIEYRRPCPPPFVINNQAHLFIVFARGLYSSLASKLVRGGICGSDGLSVGILGIDGRLRCYAGQHWIIIRSRVQ